MNQRFLRLIVLLITTALSGVIFGIAASQHTLGQTNNLWGDKSTQITNQEFLQLYFDDDFHQSDGRTSLNNGNVVSFYPASSPSQAILVIHQYYNLGGHTADEPEVRRAIRHTADADVSLFEIDTKLPIVARRWKVVDPKNAIIIRHLGEDDEKETLAVTLNGKTSFDKSDVKKAEDLVKSRNGAWPK